MCLPEREFHLAPSPDGSIVLIQHDIIPGQHTAGLDIADHANFTSKAKRQRPKSKGLRSRQLSAPHAGAAFAI